LYIFIFILSFAVKNVSHGGNRREIAVLLHSLRSA
jgi:hypothetical protein